MSFFFNSPPNLPFQKDSARGSGSKIIIFDEFAFSPNAESLFSKVIYPMLEVNDTSLILLSSPKADPDNFMNRLMDLRRSNGDAYFNIHYIVTVCDICKSLYGDSKDALDCVHVAPPEHKSKASQKKFMELMEKLNKVKENAQESRALRMYSEEDRCFTKNNLTCLLESSTRDIGHLEKYVPEKIYIFCDPNGDGNSCTTVFSCFLGPKDDRFLRPIVFLGLDIQNTKTYTQKIQMLLLHRETIRNMTYYKNPPIIFVPENNLGDCGSSLANVFRNFSDVYVIRENDKYGVQKTNYLSNLYVQTTNEMINNRLIKFSPHLFSKSREYIKSITCKYPSNTKKEIIDIIVNQLSNMRYEKLNTGRKKVTGKDVNQNDDGAVTFMMCCHLVNNFQHMDKMKYQMDNGLYIK